jgi:hypothetical protein
MAFQFDNATSKYNVLEVFLAKNSGGAQLSEKQENLAL